MSNAIRFFAPERIGCATCAKGERQVNLVDVVVGMKSSVWVCAKCWRELKADREYCTRFQSRKRLPYGELSDEIEMQKATQEPVALRFW